MHKIGLSAFEFKAISQDVKKLLETPRTYESVLLKLKGDREKAMEVLKWLLDNRNILLRVDQKLEWEN